MGSHKKTQSKRRQERKFPFAEEKENIAPSKDHHYCHHYRKCWEDDCTEFSILARLDEALENGIALLCSLRDEELHACVTALTDDRHKHGGIDESLSKESAVFRCNGIANQAFLTNRKEKEEKDDPHERTKAAFTEKRNTLLYKNQLLEEKNVSLESALAALKQEMEDMARQLEQAQAQKESLQESNASLSFSLADLNEQVEDMGREFGQLQAKLAEKRSLKDDNLLLRQLNGDLADELKQMKAEKMLLETSNASLVYELKKLKRRKSRDMAKYYESTLGKISGKNRSSNSLGSGKQSLEESSKYSFTLPLTCYPKHGLEETPKRSEEARATKTMEKQLFDPGNDSLTSSVVDSEGCLDESQNTHEIKQLKKVKSTARMKRRLFNADNDSLMTSLADSDEHLDDESKHVDEEKQLGMDSKDVDSMRLQKMVEQGCLSSLKKWKEESLQEPETVAKEGDILFLDSDLASPKNRDPLKQKELRKDKLSSDRKTNEVMGVQTSTLQPAVEIFKEEKRLLEDREIALNKGTDKLGSDGNRLEHKSPVWISETDSKVRSLEEALKLADACVMKMQDDLKSEQENTINLAKQLHVLEEKAFMMKLSSDVAKQFTNCEEELAHVSEKVDKVVLNKRIEKVGLNVNKSEHENPVWISETHSKIRTLEEALKLADACVTKMQEDLTKMQENVIVLPKHLHILEEEKALMMKLSSDVAGQFINCKEELACVSEKVEKMEKDLTKEKGLMKEITSTMGSMLEKAERKIRALEEGGKLKEDQIMHLGKRLSKLEEEKMGLEAIRAPLQEQLNRFLKNNKVVGDDSVFMKQLIDNHSNHEKALLLQSSFDTKGRKAVAQKKSKFVSTVLPVALISSATLITVVGIASFWKPQ